VLAVELDGVVATGVVLDDDGAVGAGRCWA